MEMNTLLELDYMGVSHIHVSERCYDELYALMFPDDEPNDWRFIYPGDKLGQIGGMIIFYNGKP